jgi:Flp pilus assembly protein CpaB
MQRNKRIRGRQRGRSGKVLLPALFAILLGAVGAFVTLVAFGQIKVDAPGLARFFGGEKAQDAAIASDNGMPTATAEQLMYTPPAGYDKDEWVPLVVKQIPAYTMINREHLTFAKTLRPWPKWVHKDQMGDDWITTLNAAKGRVAKYDIPVGTVLTESALMPAGTRPGLMGAIPDGQRGIIVHASDLDGAHSLMQFDHIDVFATFFPSTKDMQRLRNLGHGVQARVTDQMIREAGVQRPDLRVIVENAQVIRPVERRRAANPTADQVIEELTLAASPDDVAALTEALKAGATLYAVVRPGADPNAKLTMETPKMQGGLYGIEQIVGTTRSMVVMPDGSN